MINTTVSTYPSIAKFADLVQLKDYRPPTKKEYVRYLLRFADHLQRDPASATEDDLRRYYLFLRQQKHFGGSAMKVAKCALRCYYRELLRVEGWTVFEELRIAPPQTLPLVLNRQQVAAVLAAVRQPRLKMVLTFIYHTGLRVGEAVRVEVRDLQDTQTDHPRLHVRCGKGGKDRYVPLAVPLVEDLREWWKIHRHPQWLFPGPGTNWRERGLSATQAASRATTHLSVSAVQNTFRLARATAGLPVAATVHTLRHCYATHLLEESVDLRLISQYLGHASLETTLIYTHLTPLNEARTRAALATLYTATR